MYVTKASAGTGKTFTLAAHYIALLMSGVGHKQILAVTFTNKATAEMKERIIGYLQDIATMPESAAVQGFLNKVKEVSRLRGLPECSTEQYQQRAKSLVKLILADFDNMHITTIDSFLQTLFSGLAGALGIAAGYGIELDLDNVVSTATDQVLSEESSRDEDVRSAVVNCLKDRLANEDKWDLRPSLIRMVKEVYKESVQVQGNQLLICGREHPEYAHDLANYKANMLHYRQSSTFSEFAMLFESIRPYQEQLKDCTGARNYIAFFNRMTDLYLHGKGKFAPLGNSDLNRFNTPAKMQRLTTQDCTILYNTISRINEILPTLERLATKAVVRTKYINDLMLAGYVVDKIQSNLRESNTILLAETAYKLMKSLKEYDAQFILLKAGIRYQHIMLDEFQDTSTLQWCNFKLLIQEILSSGGTTLIVGDTKQSIYRWRSGNYEIMNGLNDDPHLGAYYCNNALKMNFRSREQIVRFNLETFKAIMQTESDASIRQMYDEGYSEGQLNAYYKSSNLGGYVRMCSFMKQHDEDDVKANLLYDMFLQMEELLAAGYHKRDMMILIRSKKDGERIIEVFDKLKQNPLFPFLHKAGKIVSNTSFRLDASKAVITIISGLKWLVQKDEVAAFFLQTNYSDRYSSVQKLNSRLPLTDLVEQLTRIFLCDDQGLYAGPDIAYLNCFRDKMRAYIGSHGSDAKAFLQYYDDKMHEDTIPSADSDDIRIMTIHTAKGLQAKNVFIPFCDWKLEEKGKKNLLWCPTEDVLPDSDVMMPIEYKDDMILAGYEDAYEIEKKKLRVDALNLLYVACTRAEDNLFISIPISSKAPKTAESAATVGDLLIAVHGLNMSCGEREIPKAEASIQKDDKPLDFSHAAFVFPTEAYRYRSTDSQVEFRQSMEAREMLLSSQDNASISSELSEKEEAQRHSAEFGNLCHAIMEKIRMKSDADRVVEAFRLRGQIPNMVAQRRIQSIIDRMMSNPKACEWFDGSWQLMREDTVLTLSPDGTEVRQRRMDRVMIRGNEAIVLDYKFGTPKREYVEQVQAYMEIMRSMGYADVRGYLWYGFTNILEEVK